MGHLRVVMAPYVAGNPYQDLLCGALTALEVDVVKAHGYAALNDALGARADVVHLHWLHSFISGNAVTSMLKAIRLVARLRRHRTTGGRLVATLHNLQNHSKKNGHAEAWLTRRVARLADRLIAHSDEARVAWLDRHGREFADKTVVVPHGNFSSSYPRGMTRDEARAHFGLPSNAVVFCYLGLIRPYKGVAPLLRAFAELRRERDDVFLLVAGKIIEPELATELDELVRATPSVHAQFSHVADDDLQKWFGAADAVVIPYSDSLTSGSGILAASFSRPIVAPRVPGAIAVAGSDAGILYSNSDSRGLVDALRDAANDRERLLSLGEAAGARAAGWAWPSIAERTIAAYRGGST